MKSAFLALLLLSAPVYSASLQQQVAARLAEVGPGTRFGLVVADEQGRELVAIDPDGRYMPGSNTKILTTAAAYADLPALDRPDSTGGAEVRLEGKDVVLVGHGDARLSSAPDCATDCLSTLADAVAAKTKRVRDVIGDDAAFADERWSPGMSWNNIPYSSGTAVSALTLDDNELALRISPGASAGAPASIERQDYLRIDNRVATSRDGETKIDFTRLPGSLDLEVGGSIRGDAKPQTLSLAIDDPALYAASRLKALLEARGVRVTGGIRSRHAPHHLYEALLEHFQSETGQRLARLTPPPLAEDLLRTNKESQNLHAELLLRRLGLQAGDPSIAGGLKLVAAMLAQAGAPRAGWDLADGSGMSTYNRVSPRAMVTLLRWIAAQPWAAAWKATLPIAGTDGTLRNRFKANGLQGRLVAKTGTLNATHALSGWLTARSGRVLAFAFFANDVPEGVKATEAMDAALAIIAEAD